MAQLEPGSVATLVEALAAFADPLLWQRYCRLAAQLDGAGAPAPPAFAQGSVEWQRAQDQPPSPPEEPLTTADEAAGRRRLARRGAPPPFAGAPSPLGAAGGAAFDDFVRRHRGPPALVAEIAALEQQLVDGFETAGRAGHYRVVGFCDGGRKELDPDWFGRMRLDFARNAVALPDGSEIVAIEVTTAPALARAGGGAAGSAEAAGSERRARAMLRAALTALWERGEFTAGTGNERVLALALRELGLSAADPPYGFKSAETVRKLRKTLNMSL